MYFAVRLYNQDSCILVANFFTINLPTGCTVGVRAWALISSCKPRSSGYRDVTATYIHRGEISSHIYAKHQHMEESEGESTVVIYIPIK